MIVFLCDIWYQFVVIIFIYVSTMNGKDMNIMKAIKSIFWINHHNTIFEHRSILQTVCVMCVFKDGVVLVNVRITFYCFKDKHILFIHC